MQIEIFEDLVRHDLEQKVNKFIAMPTVVMIEMQYSVIFLSAGNRLYSVMVVYSLK